MSKILKEITPRAENEMFFAKNTPDDKMEFPLHYHEEYELTLACTGPAQRIVGGTVENIESEDLSLIGPNVFHCYKKADGFKDKTANLTVIQFNQILSGTVLLRTSELQPLVKMFAAVEAGGGIKFKKSVIDMVKNDIMTLPVAKGVERITLFIKILLTLATSDAYSSLSSTPKLDPIRSFKDNRIDRMVKYVRSSYMNKISLKDVGDLVQLSPTAVCRYFKEKTGYTFIDFLTTYRVDQVTLGMLTTNKTIAELCFSCGFNNISNFNRAFKATTGMTPSQYREKMRKVENGNDGLLLKRWSLINGEWI